MGVVRLAIGDAVITFLWVIVAASLAPLGTIITSYFQVQPPLDLLVMTALIFLLVVVFNVVGDLLGDASFNPTANASFYAAGLGNDSLFSMAIRFPAQAIGAVGGVLAMAEYAPAKYKHMLAGPAVQVDLQTAAIAEGVLTFVISLTVFFIIFKGPKSSFLQTLLISMATVGVIVAGSSYTGPSLNPVNAYGWAYIRKKHNTWEQFYVYWLPPLVGSILAAWVFRLFFSPSAQKVKKA
ncbi:aquaporin SIP1-1-like [Nymphaea colorata]|nr:aquaporin SIP1-1-like [Nymphaea colorata]